jgi:hypothetical protein
MRQETDGVLLESYLIYEPEHQVGQFSAVILVLTNKRSPELTEELRMRQETYRVYLETYSIYNYESGHQVGQF